MGSLFSKYEPLTFYVLPSRNVEGPLGLGNPDDDSLESVEIDSLIPALNIDRIRRIHCAEPWEVFSSCKQKYEWLSPIFCKEVFNKALACNGEFLKSEEEQANAKKAYLAIRKKYRETGIEPKGYNTEPA